MKCEKCGNELLQGDKFCKGCGYPIKVSQPQKKIKKKRGCLITLLSVLAVVGIAVLCIAVFLPGFFGPKDLEIKASKEAYEGAANKLNYTKDAAPPAGIAEDYAYTYGELTDVQTSLTGEELTSFFNYNRPKYYALKKVQIRVNPDNTVEFSGALNTDYFMNKVLGGKYSEQEILNAFPLMKAIPDFVNVYARLSGEIADNKAIAIALSDVEVMGIGLPSSLYETQAAQAEIRSMLDNFLAKTTEKTKGIYTSIKVENGEVQISGKLPSSLKREEVD